MSQLIKGTGRPVRIFYEGEGDTYKPVKGSRCEWEIKVQDPAVRNFLINMFGAVDDMYRIRVYKNDELYWIGSVVNDFYFEQFNKLPFTAKVVAEDGLGRLQNIPFVDDNNAPLTGYASMVDIILICLNKLNLELPLITADAIRATIMDDTDPLNQALIDMSVFVDRDGDPLSCYDVLEQILKKKGITIRQAFFPVDFEPLEKMIYGFYNNDDFYTINIYENNLQQPAESDSVVDSLNPDLSEGYFDFFTFGFNKQPNGAIDSTGKTYLIHRRYNVPTYPQRSIWLSIKDEYEDVWTTEKINDDLNNTTELEDQAFILIDSNDLLHIFWFQIENDGTSYFRYRTRTSEGVYSAVYNFPSGGTNYPGGANAVIDSNNIIHFIEHDAAGNLHYFTINGGSVVSYGQISGLSVYWGGSLSMALFNGNIHFIVNRRSNDYLHHFIYNGIAWSEEVIKTEATQNHAYILFSRLGKLYLLGGDYNTGFTGCEIELLLYDGENFSELIFATEIIGSAFAHPVIYIDEDENIYILWCDWDYGRIGILTRIDGVWGSPIFKGDGVNPSFYYVYPAIAARG